MDFEKLMQQAQQMQEQMAKAQEELAGETVEASAGGGMVTVKATGALEITEIKISPEAIDPRGSRAAGRYGSGGRQRGLALRPAACRGQARRRHGRHAGARAAWPLTMAAPDFLRRSPLFAGFDDETLERLAAPFSEVEFPANQVLIEPRMPGAGLFVICDGTVVVEAHEVERELGPGEVVGEISLVEEDGLRRARVVAKTPVRCLALGRTEFEQMLEGEPKLAESMRELARERLIDLEDAG